MGTSKHALKAHTCMCFSIISKWNVTHCKTVTTQLQAEVWLRLDFYFRAAVHIYSPDALCFQSVWKKECAARAKNAHKFKLCLASIFSHLLVPIFLIIETHEIRGVFFFCFLLSHKCIITFAVHLVWRSWLPADRRCLILLVECCKEIYHVFSIGQF